MMPFCIVPYLSRSIISTIDFSRFFKPRFIAILEWALFLKYVQCFILSVVDFNYKFLHMFAKSYVATVSDYVDNTFFLIK